MSDMVLVERLDHVLEVTLNRPPVNAISDALSWEIYRAFERLRDDPDLWVGIVRAGGDRIFSAGWDLKEAAAADDGVSAYEGQLPPGGFAGITEFWDLKKPLIAAVNGYAIGGGFEIALACDVVLASDNASFWLPEMQRGFLPDGGAVQKLPRRIPYNVAMELFLTGRRMDAAEAARWGLVNRVVPLADLRDAARALAAEIAEGAPLAMQALKEVVPGIINMNIREACTVTKPGKSPFPIYERMFRSEDFLEGPRAFAQKRKPVWKNR